MGIGGSVGGACQVPIQPSDVAREALVGLRYSLLEAERALAAVDPELPAAERIKQALKAA